MGFAQALPNYNIICMFGPNKVDSIVRFWPDIGALAEGFDRSVIKPHTCAVWVLVVGLLVRQQDWHKLAG